MLARAAGWRLVCGCCCCHQHALAVGCADPRVVLSVPNKQREDDERLSALPTTMVEEDGVKEQRTAAAYGER